jgi:hypothetical protein
MKVINQKKCIREFIFTSGNGVGGLARCKPLNESE